MDLRKLKTLIDLVAHAEDRPLVRRVAEQLRGGLVDQDLRARCVLQAGVRAHMVEMTVGIDDELYRGLFIADDVQDRIAVVARVDDRRLAGPLVGYDITVHFKGTDGLIRVRIIGSSQ